MKKKEASARIKINHLLEEAGWRFFDDENGPANIQLEPNVKMSKVDLTCLGENFDRVKNGFVDFLLLDDKGKPFIVLEHERKVPVVIERATAEDLKATAKAPKWQTDWTSEYLADEKIEKYSLKTKEGNLIALGAYRVMGAQGVCVYPVSGKYACQQPDTDWQAGILWHWQSDDCFWHQVFD